VTSEDIQSPVFPTATASFRPDDRPGHLRLTAATFSSFPATSAPWKFTPSTYSFLNLPTSCCHDDPSLDARLAAFVVNDSGVPKQDHESEVHMSLIVAVEQSCARIIRHEIYLRCRPRWHNQNILV
jgi:hypothetical protein